MGPPFGRRWRDLFRSVQDAELPEARAYMLTAFRFGVVSGALCNVIMLGATVASGTVDPARQFMIAGGLTAADVALGYVSFTRFGRRSPETLMLVFGLLVITACLAQPWATYGGTSRFDMLVFQIVIGLAALFPWRERFSIALGLGTGALYLLFARLLPQPPAEVLPAIMVWVLALSSTTFAIAISHMQRRMWASLHHMSEQTAATSRLSSVGRLAEGLAHETRTPLASAQNDLTAAHMLLVELEASVNHPEVTPADLVEISVEARGCIESGSQGLARVASLVGSLEGHAHALRARPVVEFSVNDVVRTVVAGFARQGSPVVQIDPSAMTSSVGDPETLRRILHSLVENAVQAIVETRKGSKVVVGADRTDTEVVLWVDDDGPGVPTDLGARIFEPMVTTRKHASAVGLGLPIARDLVESVFSGRLELKRGWPGARFEVFLPRVSRRRWALLQEAHRPELTGTTR